jgi:hypothetical protein
MKARHFPNGSADLSIFVFAAIPITVLASALTGGPLKDILVHSLCDFCATNQRQRFCNLLKKYQKPSNS